MKLKDLLGRVDKRKASVLKAAKFEEKNKARKVVGKIALDTIENRVFPSLERVLRFPSNLWSWLTSAPAFAPEAPAPTPEPVIAIALVEFSAVPDAGTWTLSYDGEESGVIQFDDNAASVEAAIQEIAALSDATVTGDYTEGFEIILGEDLDVGLLEETTNSLEESEVQVDITITDITE
jgi:hypothetical protein